MQSVWDNSTVLITGATGSFGKALTSTLLSECSPKKIVLFSRDELKQHEMRLAGFNDPRLRFFIGDVRDDQRLRRAMNGIDIVVHAAAMKQVPTCEYNPIEAVLTNVMGARNVIEAALDRGVSRVLALSTDKAVNPANLYGATKLVAEKLFVHANAYSGDSPTHFSCVRYGNVVGSRGSVIPLFCSQRKTGRLSVTDPRMTRFWLTLDRAVQFVITAVEQMKGGEVFVPKIPSMRLMDLAKAIAPECDISIVGIRPGEKLHEVLVTEDEARYMLERDDMFVIQPPAGGDGAQAENSNERLDGFNYCSNSNSEWLTQEGLLALLQATSSAGATDRQRESAGTRVK
jgi:UDP-N-acetylglucosamine 4,6-dehydratase